MEKLGYSVNMGEVNSGPEQASYTSTPEAREAVSQVRRPTRRGFLKLAAATVGGFLATVVGIGVQTSNEQTSRAIDDLENDTNRRKRERLTVETSEVKFIPPENVPQNLATMQSINRTPTSTPETSPTPIPPVIPTGK